MPAACAARLAQNGRRGIAPGDVDEDALAQFDRLQILAIGAQRLFGIGAAVAIVEKCLGHLSHMALSQVLDAGNMFHGRFPAPSCTYRFGCHLPR
jgi:hypothetical protein